MIEFHATIPLLRIFDIAKARAFYLDYLGFTLDWEHRFEPTLPLYMQVSRGAVTLHLTEHHGDCCPGAAVFIQTTGVEALHAELIARGYAFLRPGIEQAPWGARLLKLTDPFGNRLLFNEPDPE
ncbi:glyoxalase superfamily protein [Chitiniphilus eburneus]|uniref:Bleomycin resistance protein n=1 Tax=Chitiniphilus eburneus TaxID=2571148 RepID=A0A4V5MQL7_9NEIS|nr:glyoxalase superfamily protein [Chitiniphilus eburneus]TJZ72988.1 VOC family protein [Chitiniphilus eburneus]